MPWIARTDGATSGEPIDLRQGVLTDIPSGQRNDWRAVDEALPAIDRATDQLRMTGIAITGGGATVTLSWSLDAYPAPVAQLRLVDVAEAEAETRSQTDRVTLGSGGGARQLVASDATVDILLRARQLIAGGFATTYPIEAANGDVISATGAQVDAAITAVADRRAAILAARNTIIAAIRAGTVTNTAGIQNHVSWPA